MHFVAELKIQFIIRNATHILIITVLIFILTIITITCVLILDRLSLSRTICRASSGVKSSLLDDISNDDLMVVMMVMMMMLW